MEAWIKVFEVLDRREDTTADRTALDDAEPVLREASVVDFSSTHSTVA